MTFNKTVDLILENLTGMDTSWKDGDLEVTIKDVIKYIENNNISVQKLKVKDLKPILIDQEYETAAKDRVEKADLSYPIIVVKSRGKLKSILDGNHRLFKAIKNGLDVVSGYVLDLDSEDVPKEFKQLFDYSIDPYNSI